MLVTLDGSRAKSGDQVARSLEAMLHVTIVAGQGTKR